MESYNFVAACANQVCSAAWTIIVWSNRFVLEQEFFFLIGVHTCESVFDSLSFQGLYEFPVDG